MSDTLLIHEIYLSVQGESTFAGWPCVFVRTTGCNLRCSYCDTAYAFGGGRRMGIDEVVAEVESLAGGYPPRTRKERLPLVELTGGEPLIQAASLPLMTSLCDRGYTVLLETSGAHALNAVDRRVRCIVDVKGPSSGEMERNYWPNLAGLRETDEVKFVLGTIEDYEWMKKVLVEHKLTEVCPVLVSWAAPLTSEQQEKSLKKQPAGQSPMTRRGLVEFIIADRLPVRFQLQMHKFIWPVDQRGV